MVKTVSYFFDADDIISMVRRHLRESPNWTDSAEISKVADHDIAIEEGGQEGELVVTFSIDYEEEASEEEELQGNSGDFDTDVCPSDDSEQWPCITNSELEERWRRDNQI